MTQSELRDDLFDALLDALEDLGMRRLAESLDIGYTNEKGLTIAIKDATTQLDVALRKISRLATRMGYIDKEKNNA
jgi:hypothetical protein